MGNHEKAVLSKKNKYYISKHRYYELKHFCLQYNEWIDPTAEIAIRRSQLQQNIETIKDAAAQTDRVLFNYLMTLRIFLAVRFLLLYSASYLSHGTIFASLIHRFSGFIGRPSG